MKTFVLIFLALLLDALPTFGQAPTSQPQVYYKRFEGTIGKAPVVMNLMQTPLGVRASYFYVGVQQPLSLWPTWPDAEHPTPIDSLIFVEQSPSEDTVSVMLYLHLVSPDAIEGSWVGKGKTTSVSLHESFTAGSARLDPYWYVDSTVLKLGKTRRGSYVGSYNILLPSAGMPDQAKAVINKTVAKIFNCKSDGSAQEIRACIRQTAKADCDSNRLSIVDLAKDVADSDLADYMTEWYDRTDISPRFNDADLLVLDVDRSAYSGGAHEMYGRDVVVLDLANGKQLKLEDVTTSDSLTLQKLLGVAARKQYHILAGQTLGDFFFEDYLPPNRNFYITQKGLGFVYSPYEVASFAQGIIDVYIPFSALKGKLTPWFIKRMAL